jgi:hypothetical protein
MTANKTTRVQHDTPVKNRFIGAMEATGKLRQSGAKYGIKVSTAFDIWTKYKNTNTTKTFLVLGVHQSLRIVQNGWWYEIASRTVGNHFKRLHKNPT